MGCRNILCKFLWAIHALGRNGDSVQMRLLHPATWAFLPFVLIVFIVAEIIYAIPDFIGDARDLVCIWKGESERSNEK